MRPILLTALVLSALAIVPRTASGTRPASFYEGDRETQLALARHVAQTIAGVPTANDFGTGSRRFDGEWLFGTYQMAALGLGQVALAHPDTRAELVPVMDRALERMLSPEVLSIGTDAWGDNGIRHLEGGRGHAYLGYANLALGMMRIVDPTTRFAPLHDRLTAELARRVERSPYGLFETYPGESYPVDVSATIGSLGLYDRATGTDHRELIARWRDVVERHYLDGRTGLLFQVAHARSGRPRGQPRASGTALAAYFLSFADREFAGSLHDGLDRSCRVDFAGFTVMREYARGTFGRGDIDSGPDALGAGLSATGFALGSARTLGREDLFTGIGRTADVFGLPIEHDGVLEYGSGGPIGNAIMLAMLTAGPGSTEARQP